VLATPTITVIEPATERELASYPEQGPEQIEAALTRASAAYHDWRERPPTERAALLIELAGVLRSRVEEYAALITREVGKPLAESHAEVEKCALGCEYYAAAGPGLLADEPITENAFVAYEPLGVILAVMPWNYPFWQVLRFAAPALMAGNAGLLKHAPNASGCAVAIEDAIRGAGAPEGLFQSLLIGAAAVPERTAELIADPRVAAVTLTGSERAGASVAAAAGRALKKTVLELGGSDPFIVLADADLDLAVEQAVKARFQNAGQSCICAKRFLVDEAIADEFEQRLADAVAALEVGDPFAPGTQVGPLARRDVLETIERQVTESVEQGAVLRAGGRRLDRPGYFFAPTVLTSVRPGMTAFAQETFGPVAAVTRFPDENTAVALANDTYYGLGASIWSRDTERARALARRVQSGIVAINAIVASDPRLPFGGIKRSGYGRELAGVGLHEFTNIRTYRVNA
jgi:succinate-semialdehyde dehydrogenase/glutarate-semialdehyde dehydrogenase